MCRDVKYIILLYSSLGNYHNTNTDTTSHSVTTGNHWRQIKQQQWSVLIRFGAIASHQKLKEIKWTHSLPDG